MLSFGIKEKALGRQLQMKGALSRQKPLEGKGQGSPKVLGKQRLFEES
jgi:hypothetical protein